MDVILKRPVISENSMKLTKGSWYTFVVSTKARKSNIIREVKNKFGVDVISANTANYKSENKTQKGRRGYFTVASFKKAIVKLKAGQKIGLFETPDKGETGDKNPRRGKTEEKVKEKRSLLKGTKVKIEKEEKA